MATSKRQLLINFEKSYGKIPEEYLDILQIHPGFIKINSRFRVDEFYEDEAMYVPYRWDNRQPGKLLYYMMDEDTECL